MVNFQSLIAIFIGKIIHFILKLGTTGASAAPGLIAEKIDPLLLVKLKKQLKYSIIISGTNGKTTTTRLISSIFKQADIPYYHNRTGSNLLRGILSELIIRVDIFGSLKPKIGLWEVDEAVLPASLAILQPRIVLINNLFRDQLDRYGEIDTLAKKWLTALENLKPQTIVMLNADDPTVASLGKKLKQKVVYYGIKDPKVGQQNLSHCADAIFCPNCARKLIYQRSFISHLGHYYCPHCGAIQPKLDIFSDDIHLKQSQLTCIIKTKKQKFTLQAGVNGLYNVYNLLASSTVALTLGISPADIIKGVSQFIPAFGRFEEINLDNKNLIIMLAKNPAGFNEVIKMVNHLTTKKPASLLIILNDLIADSQDVSWIWDVDMGMLKKANLSSLLISGTRTYDLALRIKYANLSISNKQLTINNNLKKAISLLLKSKTNNLFILPTYTAMLETRKILNQMGLVHSSWED